MNMLGGTLVLKIEEPGSCYCLLLLVGNVLCAVLCASRNAGETKREPRMAFWIAFCHRGNGRATLQATQQA